jgi:hypothetical protein
MIAKNKSHNRVRIGKSSSKDQPHSMLQCGTRIAIDNSAEQTIAPSTIAHKAEPNSGFHSLL